MKGVQLGSTWSSVLILVVFFGHIVCSNNNDNEEMSGMDRHKIFSNPLTKGVYVFDNDGFLPDEPLKRLRKIHTQMMEAIASFQDILTRAKYLVTLMNTAKADIRQLRTKLEEAGIHSAEDIVKTKVKGDAFMLLLSHAALISNCILYFPDIIHNVLQKNPEFEMVIEWVMHFCVSAKLTQNKVYLKLFDMAQQEVGLIPKKANFKNPYKNFKPSTSTPPTTTKKPRKRFARGPRMTKPRADL